MSRNRKKKKKNWETHYFSYFEKLLPKEKMKDIIQSRKSYLTLSLSVVTIWFTRIEKFVDSHGETPLCSNSRLSKISAIVALRGPVTSPGFPSIATSRTAAWGRSGLFSRPRNHSVVCMCRDHAWPWQDSLSTMSETRVYVTCTCMHTHARTGVERGASYTRE